MYDGLEITTGGQRINDYEMLKENIIKFGLNPEDFDFYLDTFKYGMPPHGGFALSLIHIFCFRDIIKRPNRHLYYNLLDEKEKLQKNIETLEVVNFNMEYYKIIYEQLLKNMPGGILISSNRKIMFANNKALELFNLKLDEKLINRCV